MAFSVLISKKIFLSACLLFVVAMIAVAEPALAGPGGKIARAVFESFWGRLLLIVLVGVFAPLIIYILVREKIASRRALKDLRFMAAHSKAFDWLRLQQRIKDCFYRVHRGWQDEDLSTVSEWMTDWYWQNQQLVHLDQWKKAGLTNVCNVKGIERIRPLLFVHRNDNETAHEESLLVVSIVANMQDYLQKNATGEIVEGSKKYSEVETIWSFSFEQGQWKVTDIDDSDYSLMFAKESKNLPAIETTLLALDMQQ